MSSHLVHDTIRECLDSLDISYEIKDAGEWYEVEVFTPLHIPKGFKLNVTYSKTIPIHTIRGDVEKIIAKRFGIIKKSGYTIAR